MRLPDLRPREFFSAPPPAQTYIQINPTLLVSWWCTSFALVIILFRLAGRWIRTERMFLEDKIMALGIIPLLVRMGFVHLVLRSGTNNAMLAGLSQSELEARVLGSKLVIPARIFYAAFLWTCKLTIAEFLQRLYSQRWKKSWDIALKGIRWFLLITFVATFVATLTGCHPFPHYWQVSPDPGPKCRQGLIQLMTMGISDIISDIALVVFPIPIILSSNMRFKRKFSLCLLFSLSLVLVGITTYRIYGTIDRHGNQQFRSLLASAEILAAAAVANALVLGSFVRDRGAKKAKFKFGSVGGDSALDRPATARTRHRAALSWGSDMDLVSDMGLRLGPEFREEGSKKARPAPAAVPLLDPDEPVSPTQPSWEVPARDSLDSQDENDLKARQHRAQSVGPLHEPSSVLTPRRLSFFDVGGLLDNGPPLTARSGTPPPPPDTPLSDGNSMDDRPLIKSALDNRGRKKSRSKSRGERNPEAEYNGTFKLQDLNPWGKQSRPSSMAAARRERSIPRSVGPKSVAGSRPPSTVILEPAPKAKGRGGGSRNPSAAVGAGSRPGSTILLDAPALPQSRSGSAVRIGSRPNSTIMLDLASSVAASRSASTAGTGSRPSSVLLVDAPPFPGSLSIPAGGSATATSSRPNSTLLVDAPPVPESRNAGTAARAESMPNGSLLEDSAPFPGTLTSFPGALDFARNASSGAEAGSRLESMSSEMPTFPGSWNESRNGSAASLGLRRGAIAPEEPPERRSRGSRRSAVLEDLKGREDGRKNAMPF